MECIISYRTKNSTEMNLLKTCAHLPIAGSLFPGMSAGLPLPPLMSDYLLPKLSIKFLPERLVLLSPVRPEFFRRSKV